jgi:heat shock protein HtpX
MMASFLVGIVFIGFILGRITGNVNYVYDAFFISLLLNFVSYFFSARIALISSGATLAPEDKYSELHTTVESLSQKAHIPKPKIYIINDPAPNAFATGRNEYNAAIAVTTGLLAMMNKSELEGVLAHELSHVKHKDILVMTTVVVLAGALSILSNMVLSRSFSGRGNRDNDTILIYILGFIAAILLPLAATLVQLSISRRREFMADAGGAITTGYPDGLASALTKIGSYQQPLQRAHAATAHLYIGDPFGAGSRQNMLQKLFMTHPPIEERVRALIGEKALVSGEVTA